MKHGFFYLILYYCALLAPGFRSFGHRAGDVHQAQIRSDEEGVRAVGALRLRDRPHHLQQFQQTVPVRVNRHGQSLAQVHGI